MDLFTAIKERRSCRDFSSEPIADETVREILEYAIWAPSPANNQPWEFVVITGEEVKERIHGEAVQRKGELFEKSGWKWLNRYEVDFLKSAPVVVAVLGDPKKTGADMFLEGGGTGYQHACAAAIQTMLLAAHGLGLAGLWFTLFDPTAIREILGVSDERDVIALVCLGKPAGPPMQAGRKGLDNKVSFLR